MSLHFELIYWICRITVSYGDLKLLKSTPNNCKYSCFDDTKSEKEWKQAIGRSTITWLVEEQTLPSFSDVHNIYISHISPSVNSMYPILNIVDFLSVGQRAMSNLVVYSSCCSISQLSLMATSSHCIASYSCIIDGSDQFVGNPINEDARG